MDSTTYTSNFRGNDQGLQCELHCQSGTLDWVCVRRGVGDGTHGSIFVELTNQIAPSILQRLAECPFVNERTLATLGFNRSSEVRQAVADNARTPVTTLMMLAHDENVDIRYQIAENYNIPDEILDELIEDENPFVSCRAELTLGRKHAQRGAA